VPGHTLAKREEKPLVIKVENEPILPADHQGIMLVSAAPQEGQHLYR
jgi:hypothetical protein